MDEDGTKKRGLSKNKICIGVATDKKNIVIIAEEFGKLSQKTSYSSFVNHIAPKSILIHNKERI